MEEPGKYVSKDEVDEIAATANLHSVGDWWVRMARAHHVAGTTKSLKESILQDFLAWALLGSFIASVAFSNVIESVQGVSETAAFLTLHIKNVSDYASAKYLPSFITLQIKAATDRAFGVDNVPVHFLVESMIKLIYTSSFMYAAVSSIKGVLAGTFKYLLFVSVPPGHTTKTISKYLASGFSSTKPAKQGEGAAQRPPPASKGFNASEWDHMGPIVTSIIAVAFGTAFGVTLAHGVLVSIPLWYMLWSLRNSLNGMKKKLWEVANDNMTENVKNVSNPSSPRAESPTAPPQSPSAAPKRAQSKTRSRSRARK